MPDALLHGKSRPGWRETLATVRQRIRQPCAAATPVAHHTGDTPSAWNAPWFLKRILCTVTGHRDPVAAGAAKILSRGIRQELYLCHACDAYSWRASRKKRSTHWSEVTV
jgi:hypothetical protein